MDHGDKGIYIERQREVRVLDFEEERVRELDSLTPFQLVINRGCRDVKSSLRIVWILLKLDHSLLDLKVNSHCFLRLKGHICKLKHNVPILLQMVRKNRSLIRMQIGLEIRREQLVERKRDGGVKVVPQGVQIRGLMFKHHIVEIALRGQGLFDQVCRVLSSVPLSIQTGPIEHRVHRLPNLPDSAVTPLEALLVIRNKGAEQIEWPCRS